MLGSTTPEVGLPLVEPWSPGALVGSWSATNPRLAGGAPSGATGGKQARGRSIGAEVSVFDAAWDRVVNKLLMV